MPRGLVSQSFESNPYLKEILIFQLGLAYVHQNHKECYTLSTGFSKPCVDKSTGLCQTTIR